MAIAPGAQFDHYEILSQLGAGGMGEVYRARDTRLDREVALKILPADFARDAERLRRFEQEARATSALNHPNILTVHDFGLHESAPYLVAELLVGEELRAQLNAGAIAPKRAIDYAQQIAAGLAAAHERGVIHRDLKPENLFVTTDGRLKILDFGLAKLKPQKLAGGVDSEAATLKPLTNPGVILGTVGYMSPEQVRGQEADHRADIFAFGMILYEMLSGRRAFSGASVADVMSAILKEEPPELSETNAQVSPALDKIVRRCLEKKPERRFQSASDLGFALEALATPSSSAAPRTEAVQALGTTAKHSRGRTASAWLAAAVLGVAAMGVAWAYFTRRAVTETPVLKLALLPPEKSSFAHIALSPDGQWLAFTAATNSKVQLWLRSLASNEAKPFEGTEGATYPFWSPDSRFIGFFADGKLKKAALGGGSPITLCDIGVGTGGTWNRDGVILVAALGSRAILRVSAAGGVPTPIVRAVGKQTDLHEPSFLPDGQHFLYLSLGPDEKEDRGTYLGSLAGDVRQRLLNGESHAIYAASKQGDGYLLFGREGALVAQPFDAHKRQLTGEPYPIAAHVSIVVGANTTSYRRQSFTASDNGLLVFDSYPERQRSQILWVDRSGQTIKALDKLDHVNMLRLAPDDNRFLVSRNNPQILNNDIWLSDVNGSFARRFTFDPGNDQFGLWSPDGQRIVWASNRNGNFDLYEKEVAVTGQETLLLQSNQFKFPTDWSRDGRYILYRVIDPQTKYDVWVLPRAEGQKPFALLQTSFNESGAVFSPDGQWIAYQSDETGRYEIYVQTFPGAGGKRQVSTVGGIGPHWRGDGKELYYYAPDGKLMAVPMAQGASLEPGTPLPLFEFRPAGNVILPYYCASRDGQRFLLSTIVETQPNAPLSVVQNWMAEMKK